MSWYNPLSWLKKRRQRPETRVVEKPWFRCGLCSKAILDDELAFDDDSGKLYHVGKCAITASGDKALLQNLDTVLNVDYINRPIAVRLYLEGRLEQKPTEEEKSELEEKAGF